MNAFIIAAGLAASANSAIPANQTIYASTCIEPESGDIAGYVATIAFTDQKPRVSFSWSEGGLVRPVAATVTDWDRTAGRLHFSVKTGAGAFTFNGHVTPQFLMGSLSSPHADKEETVRLPARRYAGAFHPSANCP